MNISITPIDKDKEEGGSWGNYRNVDLLIARASNTKFTSIFRRLSKPFNKEIERNTISEKDSENILCKSLSKGVLLNWKNFIIDNNELEYTEENAESLLRNDPDCRTYVQEFSQDLDNYLTEDLEEFKEK